ncbi:hypothetical protein GCM10008083_30940 [Ulvibacter litoralis]|nr:hypothetical protein GCM10008083_30940 [Ulvibacter litoralis]
MGTAGKFTVNVNDINAPLVTEVVLNNQPYFSSVVKNRNIMAALSRTGTFSDPVNTSFTGTWNIISDGTIMNPNSTNEESQKITSVIVTFNGEMYIDTMMETFYFDCIENPTHTPTMNEFAENSILAGAQNSEFGGTTSWTLGVFPPNPSGYLYPSDCDAVVESGTFNWAHPTNGLTRSGSILID